MFLHPRDDEQLYGLKPMNCPGHMLLFGSAAAELPRAADPLRRGGAVSIANELAGSPARAHARPLVHAGRRAHLLHRGPDRRRSSTAASTTSTTSTAFRDRSRAPSSRRGPTTSSGTDEEWDFTEGELEAARSNGTRSPYRRRRGRGLVLRAEDRPPRHRRRSAARGSSARSSSTARCPRGSGSRTWAPTTRAPGVRHPPRAVRLARALHRDPDRALRRRLPVLARTGAGARAAGRGGAPRGGARPRAAACATPYRVEVDGADETIGKRIRDAELEKIPFTSSTATASRTRALAVRERGGEQSTLSPSELLRSNLLPSEA